LAADSVREVVSDQVNEPRTEAQRLKELLAEVLHENCRLGPHERRPRDADIALS
jgi:hypothetical protein